jgi:hypothetical protein
LRCGRPFSDEIILLPKELPLKSRDLRLGRPFRDEIIFLLLKLFSLSTRTCKLDGHANP